MADGLKIFVDDNRFPSPEYDKTFQGADVMDGTKLCTELLYPDINLNIIYPKTDEVFFHSGNFEAVKTMRSKFNSAVKVGLISSLVDNKN